MAIYLGIDGGGTKTACAVGDDHRVVAHATAGGSNPVRVSEQSAREALRTAVQEACARAGIAAEKVTRTCVGMAGISAVSTRALVRDTLRELVTGDVLIVGDMEIAMEAAFGRAPGVMVVAGTGSIAFGRDESGRTARAGGWGPACSDEGSAYWIGRQAVAAALRAHDYLSDSVQNDPSKSGDHSPLTHAIYAAWQIRSREELAIMANRTPPPNFASLLPSIINTANRGDELAHEVLSAAGNELASLTAIVADRLWPQPNCTLRVAMAGGVLHHAEIVRMSFYRNLRRLRPNSALLWSVVEPVLGALAMARRGAS